MLSMRDLRSTAVGVVLCQPLFLWCGAGDMLLAQTAISQPSDQFDIEGLQRSARQEGESGKTTEAIRDYQRALRLRPEWKEGWWNLGALQYSDNQFAEARTTLRHVVEFAPDLGIAWSLLGLSEFEIQDFADAEMHLERALSLGIKDDVEVERVSSYHLGLLLVRMGKFERASDLLVRTFSGGEMSEQVKIALGLVTLRIALLPEELDPSKEAVVLAAGTLAAEGTAALDRFPSVVQSYPDIPYMHYAYGLSLEKAGRYKEAVGLMREETTISRESPLPWIEMSRLQLRVGNTNEALIAAQKAVTLGPRSKAAHERLAEALKAKGDAGRAAAEQSVADSLMTVQEAPEQRIVLRYSNANANALPGAGAKTDQELWKKAMQEYTEERYSVAAADLKAWLRQNPDNGTGWAVLGLSEFALKDFDNALIHLDRGAKLGLSSSPESLQLARYTYGILLIRAGEFDRASDVLISALRTGPLDEKVEYALGLALLRRPEIPGQEKEQEADLIRAAGKIVSLLRSSQYDAAFPQFKQLLKQYPSAPFLHYAYGTALLAVSEFDEASVQMEAERAISPGSEMPCIRLASIALRQHNSEDAITWSRRAVLLAANSAEAHYLLGRALFESGDNINAVRELETASRLSPASPEIHFNLAKAYARAKMPEKADQERATFSQLNDIEKNQRSQPGTYAGHGDAGDVTVTPVQSAPSPSRPN